MKLFVVRPQQALVFATVGARLRPRCSVRLIGRRDRPPGCGLIQAHFTTRGRNDRIDGCRQASPRSFHWGEAQWFRSLGSNQMPASSSATETLTHAITTSGRTAATHTRCAARHNDCAVTTGPTSSSTPQHDDDQDNAVCNSSLTTNRLRQDALHHHQQGATRWHVITTR